MRQERERETGKKQVWKGEEECYKVRGETVNKEEIV